MKSDWVEEARKEVSRSSRRFPAWSLRQFPAERAQEAQRSVPLQNGVKSGKKLTIKAEE